MMCALSTRISIVRERSAKQATIRWCSAKDRSCSLAQGTDRWARRAAIRQAMLWKAFAR